MCNKIHHSITAGVSASAGGGGAGSGRGAAVGRGKHPRDERPHINVTEGQETVRDMSFDCVVSKGYHCLVAALLGRTQTDGRMTISPRQNRRTFTRLLLLLLLLHLTMMKSCFTNSDVVWNPTQRCSSALPPISHIL